MRGVVLGSVMCELKREYVVCTGDPFASHNSVHFMTVGFPSEKEEMVFLCLECVCTENPVGQVISHDSWYIS